MKIFISWSGKRSQTLANAIRDWLPNVIQAIEPWVSAVDIDKGSRWSTDIAIQLEDSKVGIICLTPENLEAPWIIFEAGALSKTHEKTHVCPYLFQVEPADIEGPLVQFQATRANKNDTQKLIHTINQALDDAALPKEKLDEAFEIWWPKFEKSLENIPHIESKKEPHRSDREILEEILELVREQTRVKKIIPRNTNYYRVLAKYLDREDADADLAREISTSKLISGAVATESYDDLSNICNKLIGKMDQKEDD